MYQTSCIWHHLFCVIELLHETHDRSAVTSIGLQLPRVASRPGWPGSMISAGAADRPTPPPRGLRGAAATDQAAGLRPGFTIGFWRLTLCSCGPPASVPHRLAINGPRHTRETKHDADEARSYRRVGDRCHGRRGVGTITAAARAGLRFPFRRDG